MINLTIDDQKSYCAQRNDCLSRLPNNWESKFQSFAIKIGCLLWCMPRVHGRSGKMAETSNVMYSRSHRRDGRQDTKHHGSEEPRRESSSSCSSIILSIVPYAIRAGECPLQDQVLRVWPGRKPLFRRKTPFHQTYSLGPVLMLDRERCIVCARCTRFCDIVAGDHALEFIERGYQN